MLFEKVDTVFIPVQRLEKALHFYVEVLGGIPGWKDDNGMYQAISFGDTSITLCVNQHKQQMSNSLFSLYTPSIEEAHVYLSSHGTDVGAIMEEGAKYFIATDPDGNRIEVCSY
ncbi:VOC family protein [Sporosarcina sp. ACRSL]|uniref:VOC family protein n=1 Tax=Sporosarcina sp. ACRSL TaxID=2918215 RepID=UPI001EF540FF|nr:VOC family protein [Sporosarcina sp. ACRSL]MCG7343168.1 VOC family protein [Sporosarcina sp. ACRSL]